MQVPFTNVVYIERTDFRLKDSKDYYGLAPGKSVLLRCIIILMSIALELNSYVVQYSFSLPLQICRYAYPIKCTEVIYGDDNDTIIEIRAEYDVSKKSKPKVLI